MAASLAVPQFSGGHQAGEVWLCRAFCPGVAIRPLFVGTAGNGECALRALNGGGDGERIRTRFLEREGALALLTADCAAGIDLRRIARCFHITDAAGRSLGADHRVGDIKTLAAAPLGGSAGGLIARPSASDLDETLKLIAEVVRILL